MSAFSTFPKFYFKFKTSERILSYCRIFILHNQHAQSQLLIRTSIAVASVVAKNTEQICRLCPHQRCPALHLFPLPESEEKRREPAIKNSCTISVLYHAHRLIQRSAVQLVIASDTSIFCKDKTDLDIQTILLIEKRFNKRMMDPPTCRR